jgi:hypothetical protein
VVHGVVARRREKRLPAISRGERCQTTHANVTEHRRHDKVVCRAVSTSRGFFLGGTPGIAHCRPDVDGGEAAVVRVIDVSWHFGLDCGFVFGVLERRSFKS